MSIATRMIRTLGLAAGFAALLPAPLQAEDATLAAIGTGGITVTVAGVENAQGNIRIAVCTKDEFLKPGCRFAASAPAEAGTVTLVVPDVPPGTYAVQAYHDANGNRKIDRSFFGAPKEGIGFSNGAPMKYGPPEFAEAAVKIDGPGASTVVPLKYF